ncbi:hypothetical protein IWX78_001665 [Mycetocola sp. CAN_C7]|uniref:hypothetical protein n=1 Tax=Mycetocola sp. CAN_C7 TaxID=2787724 RepID=UPI0018C8DCFC
MTSSLTPHPVTRRERQQTLNPLRYHAMINPVRIPEPVHIEPQPKRLSVTALVLGLSSMLVGFTVIVPIAGILFGLLGVGLEPTSKRMSVAGILAALIFGTAWAAVTPLLLDLLVV